jgi:hypothetical protein
MIKVMQSLFPQDFKLKGKKCEGGKRVRNCCRKKKIAGNLRDVSEKDDRV